MLLAIYVCLATILQSQQTINYAFAVQIYMTGGSYLLTMTSVILNEWP